VAYYYKLSRNLVVTLWRTAARLKPLRPRAPTKACHYLRSRAIERAFSSMSSGVMPYTDDCHGINICRPVSLFGHALSHTNTLHSEGMRATGQGERVEGGWGQRETEGGGEGETVGEMEGEGVADNLRMQEPVPEITGLVRQRHSRSHGHIMRWLQCNCCCQRVQGTSKKVTHLGVCMCVCECVCACVRISKIPQSSCTFLSV